jgi:hypothetical protein
VVHRAETDDAGDQQDQPNHDPHDAVYCTFVTLEQLYLTTAFYTNLVTNHPVRTRNNRVVLNLIVAVRRLIKIPNCSEVVPK